MACSENFFVKSASTSVDRSITLLKFGIMEKFHGNVGHTCVGPTGRLIANAAGYLLPRIYVSAVTPSMLGHDKVRMGFTTSQSCRMKKPKDSMSGCKRTVDEVGVESLIAESNGSIIKDSLNLFFN